MKKSLIILLGAIFLIILILFADYLIAKTNKKKPIFSLKRTNTENQVKIYIGLFYKIYQCEVDSDIYYITNNPFSKINDNFCPKKYIIDFKDNYYTNNKNVRISKDDYEKLSQFYSTKKIANMTEDDLNKAYDEIKKWVPITN